MRFAGWSRRARAPERVKITGALETASTRRAVASDAPDRSARTPSRFISRTTSSPNGVSPPGPAHDVPESVTAHRPRLCSARSAPSESPSAAPQAGPISVAMRPQLRASAASERVAGEPQPLGVGGDECCTKSICSSVAPTGPPATGALGHVHRQNCAPTRPARSRGTSLSRPLSPDSKSCQGQLAQRPGQSAVAVGDRVGGEQRTSPLGRSAGSADPPARPDRPDPRPRPARGAPSRSPGPAAAPVGGGVPVRGVAPGWAAGAATAADPVRVRARWPARAGFRCRARGWLRAGRGAGRAPRLGGGGEVLLQVCHGGCSGLRGGAVRTTVTRSGRGFTAGEAFGVRAPYGPAARERAPPTDRRGPSTVDGRLSRSRPSPLVVVELVHQLLDLGLVPQRGCRRWSPRSACSSTCRRRR